MGGEYTVLFEWLSGNDLMAFDKFGGRFANPSTTEFTARVEPRPNHLSPFAITILEADLVARPPEGR